MNAFPLTRAILLITTCALLAPPPIARAADGDRPPAPPQGPGGGGGGPGGGGMPMMFGGPFGGRDAVADLISTLGELNLSPDFNFSRDQKEQIQAAREQYKSQQDKWRTDHADDLRKLQDQMMALFQRGGNRGGEGGGGGGAPPGPEQFQAINKARQELMATSPDAGAAADRIAALLTDAQRIQLEAWRDDPAHKPANPFGGPQAANAPSGQSLPADAIPKQPGFYRLKFQTTVQLPAGPKRVSMAYVLYLPQGYDASNDRLPVLVFLHGAGETGTDGSAVFVNGPAMELQRQGASSPFAKNFPFVLICPQCPPRGERWDQPVMLKAVLNLLDDVAAKVRTDPDRVYVTGLSMGGKGTWLLSIEAPGRFAAIAPIAADTLDARGAATLKSVATWAIVGADDFGGAPEANQKMVAAIKAAGGDAKVTILPGEGHFVWPKYYADPAFYDWFLTHKRSPAAAAETNRAK